MAIEVHCSHCQKLLRVKAELAGKRVKCPACGQPLTIPLPERPSSADLPLAIFPDGATESKRTLAMDRVFRARNSAGKARVARSDGATGNRAEC